MRMSFKWLFFTEKRLWKKPGYLLVLVLVPILVFALRIAMREEAGMVTIGLCSEEKGELSEEILQELMEEKGVLRYIDYPTEKEALRGLEGGYVKAVWIFPEKLEEKFTQMAKAGRITPVVQVVEREDDVSLIFTREILCSRLFPRLAYETYRHFVRDHLEGEISDEELLAFYQKMTLNDQLFEGRHIDGSADLEEHYLLSPIRGLLSVWLVVCGLAAVLFFQKDLLDGVYDSVPAGKRIRFALGTQLVVLGNGGVVYLAALGVLGVTGHFSAQGLLWEILCLVLFLGCVCFFCTGLQMALGRLERTGACIPILVILMIALCPIFFRIRLPYDLQGILPPYYYLMVIHDASKLWNMLIYLIAGSLFCLGWNKAA